ncbi:helix-turn-helix transcriptional regulator [Marinobacter sp. Arc7-DN-1]|uniref:helix-turn-helix transcriptional regulator n=1 Tax=Marinobacter sp. Arc7-DN-1 TaxID=2304594 RepID=UPI000E4521DA|nr:AlpA family transcriptional regulator [Marinobacter sp. Arc7-DN-1]AXS83249.1 AlpA family transcriptional regulator [Marinobacter sp. Arc7-DN-1]
MTDRVLRRKEVTSMVGLGTTKIYELISEGRFPKPIKLSVRSVGWLESEIQAWIKEQAEKRETSSNA